MERITDKQLRVLYHLGKYKFLSTHQLAKLMNEKWKTNFSSKVLKPLHSTKKPLIIQVAPNKKNTEKISLDEPLNNPGNLAMYYLSQRGANLLELHFEEKIKVRFPMRKVSFSTYKYWHHLKTVNLQIALNQQEIPIDFYLRDIDKVQNVRKGKYRISESRLELNLEGYEYFEPDAIFALQGKLFLLESERRQMNNKKQLFEKIEKHLLAIQNRIPAKKFDMLGHRVLFVLNNESLMNEAIEFTRKIRRGDEFFLFKLYHELVNEVNQEGNKFIIEPVKEYFKGWRTFSGLRDIL